MSTVTILRKRKGNIKQDTAKVLHQFSERDPQGNSIGFFCVKLDHPERNARYVFNKDKMNVRMDEVVNHA